MLTRYKVERLSGGLGKPVPLDEAVRIVTSRIQRLEDGDVLKVRKVLYELPPEGPPNMATGADYTAPMLRGYRSLVATFPKVGWAGGFVCKFASGTSRTTSQHAVKVRGKPSAGNAVDWTAPGDVEQQGGEAVVAWLTALAGWIIEEQRAGRRATSEVIWRDRKWTPERGWRPYTGPFHAAHVHESAAPYVEAHAACLD